MLNRAFTRIRRLLGGLIAWLKTPAGLVFLLAPLISQLLTGAKPPGEFFLPHALAVALVVYGCGALIVHEWAVIWREGEPEGSPRLLWPRLLLLAVVFGLLIEGVMLKNITSPDWTRLGPLADTQHGRLLGINWNWALFALSSHVILAVAVPILIVELLKPQAAGQRWLSDRGLRRAAWLFGAAVAIGALANPTPAPEPYLGVLLVTLALALRARSWHPRRPRPLPLLPPWRVGLAAAVVTVASLIYLLWIGDADWFNIWWLILLVPFGHLAAVLYVARRTTRRVLGGWSERHNLAMVVGALVPWAVLAPLQDADAYHTEAPGGMGLVGLLAALAICWLVFRVRRRPYQVSRPWPEPECDLSPAPRRLPRWLRRLRTLPNQPMPAEPTTPREPKRNAPRARRRDGIDLPPSGPLIR